ncbi:MAG: uracil-DNA glycosylase [Thermosynechococcus sp. Uc]|uniref:uracil-DNA glycosylase n=1 Tax=Thermosynechococcus sp. Uc TaxID=3034853 RepID=UPI0019E9BE9D|nr:uracil-DNA glycosylase [Thermosynechococcus sp. Uc]MDM7326424.1 uracil-DNA glycosylase [Thermosynechococcus sp. Uc]HIK25773.1 uracil-DNA glycosylase [Thermosynechococcus sp. M46_R2017_013]
MSEPLQFSLFDSPTEAQPAPTTPLDAATYNQIPLRAEVPIPAGTYRDLEALAAHCQQCQRCGLATSRTHVVISRGNPAAKLMIIGEGPGQSEDETGRPFVGKAGQLLDKILASVNLDSERDAYICNIVKCRPPGNRVPTPVEAAACLPYLLEQIRLVNPRIILLAGATAVSGLLKDHRGITKIRGQWIEWQGRWCMPIFHPAYLLRNNSREPGSPKWLTWQDIQAVRDRLRQLDS